MIQLNQPLTGDVLNSAFVSKKTTGTQILLGGLYLKGGITTESDVNVLGVLNAATIKTSGRIDADTFYGKFNGDGSAITNINGSNIASGTVADARLTSNVFLLNKAQTVTANTTFNGSIFFNGTTYKVDSGGNATLNQLDVKGLMSVSGNRIDYPALTMSATKISFWGGTGHNYMLGNESYHMLYGKGDSTAWNVGHKFYDGVNLIAQLGYGGANNADKANSKFFGNVVFDKDIDIYGSMQASVQNEFPDAQMLSGNITSWITAAPTITLAYDPVQAPTGTGAYGSLKITTNASNTDGFVHYEPMFDVNASEWVTFSSYAFSTSTGTVGSLYFIWFDSAQKAIANTASSSTFTLATSWTRYSLTAQAPANARYFRVRLDIDTASKIGYFSAFQVERGRTLTLFKPFGGGKKIAFNYEGVDGKVIAPGNTGIRLKNESEEIEIGTSTGKLLLSSKVAIGHSNPGRSLDVLLRSSGTDDGVVIRSSLTATNTGLHMWAGATGFVLDARKGDLTGTADLHLRTGGTDRLIVKSDGAINIGTVSTSSLLNVGGNVSASGTIYGLSVQPLVTGKNIITSVTQYPAGMSVQYGGGEGHPSQYGTAVTFYGDTSRNFQLFHVKDSVDLHLATWNETQKKWLGPAKIWNSSNQGSGSGMDADTVDGKHSADLMSSGVARELYTAPTGGIKTGTAITIPNNKTYVMGSNRLIVVRDRQMQIPTIDYTESTTNSIKFTYDIPTGTLVEFIIFSAG